MSQTLGTSTTEMWIHRSKKQQREQQRQSLEKRTTEGLIPQPTKLRTTTPSAPSPSVTFSPTPPYIPKTPEGVSSNLPLQLMIVDTPNIFSTILHDIDRKSVV